MAKSSSDSIGALVANFAEQLSQIVRRQALEQVLAHLQNSMGGAAPARRGRPKGSKNAAPAAAAPKMPKSKGGRRSSEHMEQMQSALLEYVTKNPGQRGEQIAAARKTDVGTMRLPMKKLIAEKKVRTQGQRRGMTYFGAGAAMPAAAKSAKPAKAAKKGRKPGRRGKKKAA